MALARLLMLLLTAGCAANAEQPPHLINSSPVADRWGWSTPHIVIQRRTIPSSDA